MTVDRTHRDVQCERGHHRSKELASNMSVQNVDGGVDYSQWTTLIVDWKNSLLPPKQIELHQPVHQKLKTRNLSKSSDSFLIARTGSHTRSSSSRDEIAFMFVRSKMFENLDEKKDSRCRCSTNRPTPILLEGQTSTNCFFPVKCHRQQWHLHESWRDGRTEWFLVFASTPRVLTSVLLFHRTIHHSLRRSLPIL